MAMDEANLYGGRRHDQWETYDGVDSIRLEIHLHVRAEAKGGARREGDEQVRRRRWITIESERVFGVSTEIRVGSGDHDAGHGERQSDHDESEGHEARLYCHRS